MGVYVTSDIVPMSHGTVFFKLTGSVKLWGPVGPVGTVGPVVPVKLPSFFSHVRFILNTQKG